MTENKGKIKSIAHRGGWFRIYANVINDPKVQTIPDRLFKFWVNCLAITCERRGYLPDAKEIAFRLRLSVTEAEDDLACLMTHGLIDAVKVGNQTVLQPHDWFEWQPKADPSKWRMKRFRERQKSTRRKPSDGHVTRHVTERDGSRDGKVRTSTSTTTSVSYNNLSIQEGDATYQVSDDRLTDALPGGRTDDEVSP